MTVLLNVRTARLGLLGTLQDYPVANLALQDLMETSLGLHPRQSARCVLWGNLFGMLEDQTALIAILDTTAIVLGCPI
jgi:hypothetical protein